MKIAALVPNYNGSDAVLRVVGALLAQSVPPPHRLEVVVVDDGSSDGSADRLEERYGSSIQLVRLDDNMGRSFARNAAAKSTGTDVDLLIFVDSDCVPAASSFISTHLACIESGADLVFGDVIAQGPGFWAMLQREVADARRRRYLAGDAWAFTTANFSVRRPLLFDNGGFDSTFDRYGFEDRDLFARLATTGARVMHTSNAAVIHLDQLTLEGVATKQCEAGRYGSTHFNQRHPDIYRSMSLSRVDCGLHPWLAVVDVFTAPLARALCARSDAWLEWNWLPFRLRSLAARVAYGLLYMHGTRLAARDVTNNRRG